MPKELWESQYSKDLKNEHLETSKNITFTSLLLRSPAIDSGHGFIHNHELTNNNLGVWNVNFHFIVQLVSYSANFKEKLDQRSLFLLRGWILLPQTIILVIRLLFDLGYRGLWFPLEDKSQIGNPIRPSLMNRWQIKGQNSLRTCFELA